jgi:hypothetical protein
LITFNVGLTFEVNAISAFIERTEKLFFEESWVKKWANEEIECPFSLRPCGNEFFSPSQCGNYFSLVWVNAEFISKYTEPTRKWFQGCTESTRKLQSFFGEFLLVCVELMWKKFSEYIASPHQWLSVLIMRIINLEYLIQIKVFTYKSRVTGSWHYKGLGWCRSCWKITKYNGPFKFDLNIQ